MNPTASLRHELCSELGKTLCNRAFNSSLQSRVIICLWPLHTQNISFLGCYWHRHSYLPNIGSELQQERFTKTRLRLQYTLELGYDLEVMWECEWRKRNRVDGDVGRFVKAFEKVWYPRWSPLPTGWEVLNAVKDGSFFSLFRGYVRVAP